MGTSIWIFAIREFCGEWWATTFLSAEQIMKCQNILLTLLCGLVSVCAGNSGASVGGEGSTAESMEQPGPAKIHWPSPEQERWVDEPVFNGKLHLVESGRTNQQTIVLIHGLGYYGLLDWLQVFPALTANYHVIAIDLPGFGGSDKQQIQYAPQKYAELVSWVVGRFAHDSVIVIGHSMGAAVSLRYAYDYPEQVSRLVMVDTAGILQRTVFIKHMAKLPTTHEWLEPYQKRIPGLRGFVKKLAGTTDKLTRSLLVTMDRLPDIPQLMMSNGLAKRYLYKDHATLNAALGLVYEDFSRAAREVAIPTHIIWGDRDTVAPVRTGILLAGLLPNAELHQVNEAGHVPMTDNFEGFMQVLKYSLENEPQARQAQKRLLTAESKTQITETLYCDGQVNQVFTGHYQSIQLKNCHGIVLRDLVAESVVMVSSDASLENVQLNSPGTALLAIDSVVTATLLHVDARVGLEVGNSYLDLAGATISTSNRLIEVRQNSPIYFSLSEHRQGDLKKELHGVSLGPVFSLQ